MGKIRENQANHKLTGNTMSEKSNEKTFMVKMENYERFHRNNKRFIRYIFVQNVEESGNSSAHKYCEARKINSVNMIYGNKEFLDL